MANSALKAVPGGEQKAPEGRQNRVIKNPDEAEVSTDTRSLRGVFAKSLCKAHDLGSLQEREACLDGVPCTKLPQCMALADSTLRYMDTRKTDDTS